MLSRDVLRLFIVMAACVLMQNCVTGSNRATAGLDPEFAATEIRPASQPQVAGIEQVYARPVTAAEKPLIFDCREYSAAITGFRSETPHFDLFNDELTGERRFYLTEEEGWPFVIGYHHLRRVQSDTTWFVTLRGESSGFHSSSVSKPILKMMEELPGAAMITIDEYKYHASKKVAGKRAMHPICHRTRYPERYINTESPGFENGGAHRILRRVLPSANPIVVMSYSNSTTPRGELIRRLPKSDEPFDFKNFGEPRQFLKNYIDKTTYDPEVYPAIKGFIDIEGNYEYKKSFWDLLAYIKLEIEPDPAKFYYSAVRIEKFDAYPVQTTMIRALGLEGIENDEGVIRFTNRRGNVVVDIITNHFQPYYSGVGGDIRKNTRMKAAGPGVKRNYMNHYMMGPFIHKRLLYTTDFLKKEMAVRPAATAALQ